MQLGTAHPYTPVQDAPHMFEAEVKLQTAPAISKHSGLLKTMWAAHRPTCVHTCIAYNITGLHAHVRYLMWGTVGIPVVDGVMIA